MAGEELDFQGNGGEAISPTLELSLLAHDATSSVRGTIYQIGVAVMKCFELTEGETLYFEKFGDVTVEGREQVETKHYNKPLTDLSPNFWKTLNNWMQEGFDPAGYRFLVLYTSQTFGKTSRIAAWNALDLPQRVALLTAIAGEIQSKETVRRQGKPKAKPSELSVYAGTLLHPANAAKLLQILERFSIEADSPKLPDLHKRIKDIYLKGSMGAKRDDFLDALFGFIIRPEKVDGTWSITYDEFRDKFQELTSVYCKGTVFFPKKYITTRAAQADDPQVAQHKDHRFIEKILEIEHGERVAEAVRDYLGAVNTIQKEFRDYAVSNDRTEDYTNSLRGIFSKKHRIACLKAKDSISDSQVFYDEFTSETPLPFEGFNSTPVEFRNGLVHTQIDDPNLNLQWKVESI